MVVLLISNILQWLYYFRHKGRITLPKIRFNITKDLGVSHGDDNFIMYKQWDPVEALKSEEDAKFTKKLVSMWTNFATHGEYRQGCRVQTNTFDSNLIYIRVEIYE